MFYDILWVAFFVELLVGILAGWLLATYYFNRRDSAEPVWTEEDTQDIPLSRQDGSGSSGKAGVVRALAKDRGTLQRQVLRLEESLAQAEALYEQAHIDLTAAQAAVAQREAVASQRESEIENLKAKLAEKQSKNASTESQISHYQAVAAEAQALAKALDQSKSDLSKTAMRLQADLDEARQSREKTLAQLEVYKEKLRIATAQHERAKSP